MNASSRDLKLHLTPRAGHEIDDVTITLHGPMDDDESLFEFSIQRGMDSPDRLIASRELVGDFAQMALDSAETVGRWHPSVLEAAQIGNHLAMKLGSNEPDFDVAMEMAQKALRREMGESRFKALKGQLADCIREDARALKSKDMGMTR